MSSYRPQKYLSNSKLAITWTIWRLEDWNMLELPILRSCNFDLENHSHSAQIRNVHSSCLKENIHVAHVLCLNRSFFLGKSHGSPTASLEKPHLLRGPPAELAGDAAPETADENPCRTVHSNLDFGGKKYLQCWRITSFNLGEKRRNSSVFFCET